MRIRAQGAADGEADGMCSQGSGFLRLQWRRRTTDQQNLYCAGISEYGVFEGLKLLNAVLFGIMDESRIAIREATRVTHQC